jgi:hypothetical protein
MTGPRANAWGRSVLARGLFEVPTMSLRESEFARRARSHHRKQHKQQGRSALDRPLSMLLDDQVLTLFEWARLNRISLRTARRILNSGNGPIVNMLSAKRIGITVGNNRAWQQSRERT